MWLKRLQISNFRGIESLEFDLTPLANVIVGPNAIGKTTLLEAIRLAKATLAPRLIEEAQQVFMGLGAISPHNPSRLNYRALARDISRPLRIEAVFELNDNEIAALDGISADIARSIVTAGMGTNSADSTLGLVQYLSTTAGQQALERANQQVATGLPNIRSTKSLSLDLTIDPGAGTIRGGKLLDQQIFGALEARLPAHQALFSYFPADRALPSGEAHIQIGGPDIAAQLQSHNSQPQTKFNRLKPTIINSILLSEDSRSKIRHDFERIFSQVLKDRSLKGIQINEFGLVSIEIQENTTHRTFDIDGMSSGEKGLILTFLLISRSIANGGLIMLDEPELHLNPAVCKTILPFLIEEYLKPNQVQAIICSHSPEVLGSAFDANECALLHLQSPTVLSKIFSEDRREVFDALRRLGTSASDVLFSAGSIFFEGPNDIDILQAGFSNSVIRYNITELGGRSTVEKEIRTLQEAEKRRELDTLKCFIFDLDRSPTNLSSSTLVKVLQWRRRCLENYLIDEKIIYDLLRDKEFSRESISSRGEALSTLKEIAFEQLRDMTADHVYREMNYENSGLRPYEIEGKAFSESAVILFDRLSVIQNQLDGLDRADWLKQFNEKCEAEYLVRKERWNSEWIVLCDGKRFFKNLHMKFGLKISPIKLKRLIVERMERENTEAWVLVNQLLTDALR